MARLAEHKVTGQPFVLKYIPFKVHDATVRKNVIHELTSIHKTVHPSIVTCYQSFLEVRCTSHVYMSHVSLTHVSHD